MHEKRISLWAITTSFYSLFPIQTINLKLTALTSTIIIKDQNIHVMCLHIVIERIYEILNQIIY